MADEQSSGISPAVPAPGAAAHAPVTDRQRVARRARMQALAGASVRGGDGSSVGLVRDIYLHDATGELAAISVVRRQLSSKSVLIPAAAIDELPAEPAASDGSAGADESAADGSGADRTTPDETTPDETAADGPEAADRDPQTLWLHLDASAAREGLRPPDTGHVTPAVQREAERALGLEPSEGDPTDR